MLLNFVLLIHTITMIYYSLIYINLFRLEIESAAAPRILSYYRVK